MGIQQDIHESRHTGQGKYECSICGKRFPQKGEVKNHEMQHGEERGFTCDHCGKSFNRDAYLRIHMKTHLKKDDVAVKTIGSIKRNIELVNDDQLVALQQGIAEQQQQDSKIALFTVEPFKV